MNKHEKNQGAGMKAKVYLSIVGGIVVAAVVTSYASPYWTMREMRTAIVAKDADAFSSHVDFPALRENVRAQLLTKMKEHMPAETGGVSGLEALGMAIGMGVANQVIDTMVTPDGVMTMMGSGNTDFKQADDEPSASASDAPVQDPAPAASQPSDEQANNDSSKMRYAVGYKNWSTVTVSASNAKSETLQFIFKRDGFWSWKLSAIQFPGSPL